MKHFPEVDTVEVLAILVMASGTDEEVEQLYNVFHNLELDLFMEMNTRGLLQKTDGS